MTTNFPVENDVCSFCVCEDLIPTLKKCPSGYEWDPAIQICVKSDRCNECPCGNCPLCFHGMDYPITNPSDKCKYCLCSREGSVYPVTCPPGFAFNKTSHDCDILDPDCGQCAGVVCPDDDEEHHYPRIDDPTGCSFCCCLPHSKRPIVKYCPFHEKYNPSTNTCDDSTKEQCANVTVSPPPIGGGGGGCDSVTCPMDPKKAPLYPAGDPRFFCQCDWGGMVHQMPCSPGTTFSQKLQACL
ncbi:kielin/chordin-like protein [Hetaerina americana]|uniref:kielin/chordin-like protein n=1 Tax=Hetaerina americana TaxID=62018 RepID=UPI003A7F3A80